MVSYSACYHHLSFPRFGNPSKILVFTAATATGLQMTTLCSGRGSNPNCNGSHIPSHHMKDACQPSHGMEGHMEPSSAHSTTCICQDLGSLLKSRYLVHCWATRNDTIGTIVQCGGSNPTWNGSHILSEHRKIVPYVGMLRSLRFRILAIWLLITSCKDL